MPDQTPPNDDFTPIPDFDEKYMGGDPGHREKDCDIPDLTGRQLRAIELLAQGNSDVRVASLLGISRKTVWRWKTCDETFRQVLTDQRVQNFSAATDRYQNLLIGATKILSDSLKAGDEKDRFKAARVLFNMASAFRPVVPKNQPKPNNDDEDWPLLPPKVG